MLINEIIEIAIKNPKKILDVSTNNAWLAVMYIKKDCFQTEDMRGYVHEYTKKELVEFWKEEVFKLQAIL